MSINVNNVLREAGAEALRLVTTKRPTPKDAAADANAVANAQANAPDRDMFMRLLVAQLKNQDPLAPQDGAQFVAQLAQFNSLDQLTQINDRLGRLLK